MPGVQDTTRIATLAEGLLRGGAYGSVLAAASGRIEIPVPVWTPEGGLHSWFVPVSAAGRLAGYFRFLPDLTLTSYSSFQRDESSVGGCPSAESWTDAAAIRARAAALARSGEIAGEPRLTYDRAPSRLAWAVPLASPGGAVRTIMVAGSAVWESAPAGGEIDSYGRPPLA